MANIVTWGSRVLKVTASQIYTFTEFQRKTSYSVTTKDRSGKKPTLTKKGPGLESISFSIPLDAGYVSKPQKIVDAWIQDCEAGTSNKLYFGGKQVGSNSWIIENMSMTNAQYDKDGNLISCKLSITMLEHVIVVKKKKKKKKSKKKKTTNVSSSKKPTGNISNTATPVTAAIPTLTAFKPAVIE